MPPPRQPPGGMTRPWGTCSAIRPAAAPSSGAPGGPGRSTRPGIWRPRARTGHPKPISCCAGWASAWCPTCPAASAARRPSSAAARTRSSAASWGSRRRWIGCWRCSAGRSSGTGSTALPRSRRPSDLTVERGRAYAQLGRELGFQEEVDWMLEMLGWPVEWNGLHGIAQVTTPVCRISTRTDATAERLVVQRTGTRYPDEGARGLHFPFKVGGRPPAAKPPRVEPVPAHGMPSWHVNGFSSRTVQEAAHRAILEAVREQPVLGPVLDLGAGDGLLAQRLAGATGAAAALAVEVEPHRAAAAQHRLGRDQVAAGCLSREWPGRAPYGLVALMPGRLLELPTEYAEVVRRRLSAEASLVLLYGYGCWLEPGGLAGLAERAGLGDWVPAGSLARGGPPDLAVAAQLVQPTPVEAKAVLS